MMKRGRGEVVLSLPKIKRLYPDLCFDHPWKMEKTTKELETALPTLSQFIHMGTQVGRFHCPRTCFRTKWRSSISQCLQWTLHWVSWTYTKVQVSNSHCQRVHSERISIFLLLWMWEPFTQLCIYSQGQQLHVSFMQRTMFVSMVSPQEKRRHSLQSQWTQIHLIQTALGAEHVRHAYEVVPSPKIKHQSSFTEATKTTNETSDTWSHDLQDIQHQVTNFPLSRF